MNPRLKKIIECLTQSEYNCYTNSDDGECFFCGVSYGMPHEDDCDFVWLREFAKSDEMKEVEKARNTICVEGCDA
jgi:hypothetical protein